MRLVEGGRDPPALQLGQPKMQHPSSLHRCLGQARSRTDVRNRVRRFSVRCAALQQAHPAGGVADPEKLGLEPPDLGAHGRVVELDQEHPLANPRSLVHVEHRDHPRLERMDLPGALPGDDLAAGRGDDVDLRDPGGRPRGDEQQGEDEDYAHRARCGGTQRDHMSL